jgi:hypothetical protein
MFDTMNPLGERIVGSDGKVYCTKDMTKTEKTEFDRFGVVQIYDPLAPRFRLNKNGAIVRVPHLLKSGKRNPNYKTAPIEGRIQMLTPPIQLAVPRDTCLQCVAKHLGQANVLLKETCKGYPEHYFIAVGHLAEAEDECIMDYPAFAAFLRDLRLQLEDDADFRKVYPWNMVFIQLSDLLAKE